MADQIKQNQNSVLIVAIAFLVALQAVPYLNYLDILPEQIKHSAFVKKASMPLFYYLFRIIYVFIVIASFSLFISIKLAKKITKEDQKPYKRNFWLLTIFIMIGTINHPYLHYYNIFFLPILIIAHLFNASRGFAKLGAKLEEEEPFGENNQKELKEMGLIYQTDKGPLHVHNVYQGIYVTGGAGAGKSASIIEPAIYQWAKQNMSMTIYDFKGNPPTLGLMAYNSWLLENDSTRIKPKFEVINVYDLKRSSRPNPINPLILNDSTAVRSITETLLITLSPEWRDKADFWAQSAFNLCFAVVERLRNDPIYHNYCTIPHLIELITLDYNKLITWLREDNDVQAAISAFVMAQDKGADQQLAGMVGSLQTPIAKLVSKEVYWVFGAELEKQSSIDMNDPQNPKIVSISNNPPKKKALAPVISSLLRSIINVVNQQGKHPHALIFDEQPTIYIQELSGLPATARSNKVSMCIGIQDFSQLNTQYGKEAKEIPANLGTQFMGMTNNIETASDVAKMMGTYKKTDTSHSTSDSSISFSDRTSNEKVLQEKDVMGQPVGHFVGKIAGGDPPFFSVQINEFKKSEHFPNWKNEIDIEIEDEFIRNMFNSNPESADLVFEQIIECNYLRIKAEAQEILKDY